MSTPPSPIVFFGTPAFAVPTLEAVVEAGHEVALVVTQPGRRAGRRGVVRQPAVAVRAEELGLAVAQPERASQRAFRERLEALAPAVAVVVAFGQIFSRRLLEVPELGCVNLHASLLPRWRGAAPIAAAVAAGDRETGVTTMRMVRALDAGPILLQRRLGIGWRETAVELGGRLAAAGAELMVETLAGLAAGSIAERPQDDGAATFAPRLCRDDGRVDWSLPARALLDRWRAYQPWPGLHAELAGRPVKLVEVEPADAGPGGEAPGEVLGLRSGRLAVRCGDGGAVALLRLQRPGGRPMAAPDFVNGERLEPGDRFA